MATASSPFVDQTDEDFFDKLVMNDDSGELNVAGSGSSAEPSVMDNLSIGDDEDAGLDSDNAVEAPKEESLVESFSDSKDVGSKGKGVRVVQWSSFNVDSDPFSSVGFGSDSEFVTEDSKNAVVSNDQVADVNGSRYWGNSLASRQSADVDNTQFWDNGTSVSGSFNADSEQFGSITTAVSNGFSTNMHLENAVVSSEQSALVNNSQYWGNATASSEHQDDQFYVSENLQSNDTTESQNWEDLYPGWKYDHSTGQWYQIEGLDSGANTQSENYNVNDENLVESSSEEKAQVAGDGLISDQRSEISYLQQSAKLMAETVVAEDCATGNVSNWNQVSQENTRYPPNMVFDLQYPEWYYDTNTQRWYTLESYTQTTQHTDKVQDQSSQVNATDRFISRESSVASCEQVFSGNQGMSWDWNGSANSYAQQNAVQQDNSVKSALSYTHSENFYGSPGNATTFADQQRSFKMFEPVASKSFNANGAGFQNFVPGGNVNHFNRPKVQQTLEEHLADSYFTDPNPVNYSQQQFQGSMNASHSQFSYVNGGRSSAGRPPHALVSFGFGGKLIVMKDSSSPSAKLDYSSKDNGSGTISIHNLMEVVMENVDALSSMNSSYGYGYFDALCRQSFPGPLVGGHAAAKDVNKWIDERIQHSESSTVDARKGEPLRLLLSLLKISCQHYGKLRPPFGIDPSLEETDGPESTISKLFTCAKTSGARPRDHGPSSRCLQNIPSEAQILATAHEVQNLLVSGRRKEALHRAQAGQLWGPALVLAAQLGEKYYIETVKQMAQRQFTTGSPLRTLCLLIARQPADVFSAEPNTNSGVNVPQQTTQVLGSMLDDWEENLAIITANRTKDDELVIVHLGDCLWKERGEITAAHTCYLVAEANFESYSDTARLCLIGADHWKAPRTYASPEAIQRTEIYEYSKVLGNSQFVLLQFQPYKIVYAFMLAEVGKVSDSLRYCQASVKLLKNSGRAPEVEMWKSLVSSLEERLRTSQQGGYSTNLAGPTKLVGKWFSTIDRSINRMMGGATSPLPPLPLNVVNGRETHNLEGSQSTMAMSSLIPSASVEGISEWTADSNRKNMHARSVSEPDFGRNSKQDSSKDSSSTDAENKVSPSRFGRIGSTLLKSVGWVSRSRQAKLGETNKFYYDEKLKRWVEEGAAAPPAEEIAPPPPPTAALFQNGSIDYNINNAFKSPTPATNGVQEAKSPTPAGHSSGIPSISPGPNQFSARGRMGVRSRYVDTFNKSGVGKSSTSNSFPLSPVPTLKPLGGAKFFVPVAPATPDEQTINAPSENNYESTSNGETSYSTINKPSFSPLSPPSLPSTGMPCVPSMNNIIPSASNGNNNGSSSSHSRRASWSGGYGDMFNPNKITEPVKNGGIGDDLHEVAL